MKYKYETHLHTVEASACGESSIIDYIGSYKELEYSGICITDHFFNGNTNIPDYLSWEERINLFCKPYEIATELCKEDSENFKVFHGMEMSFGTEDYLVFGFDKDFLLNHPELESMNCSEVFSIVNDIRGLMIQAHPFRLREYIESIQLHPFCVHAIEAFNGHNSNFENDLATYYAGTLGFPMTGGSDIHNVNQIFERPGTITGVAFDSPVYDIFDFCKRIKFGKFERILNSKMTMSD